MLFRPQGDFEKLTDVIHGLLGLAARHPGKAAGVFVGVFSFQIRFMAIPLISAKHLIILMICFSLGAALDYWLQKRRDDPLATIERLKGSRRLQYLRVLFAVMGHIAKADGRVSEDEIKVARGIMARLELSKAEVNMAIKAFTRGKDADFPLANTLYDFYQKFRLNIGLRERFIRVQIQAVLAGDGVSHVVARLLQASAAQLDIPNQRVHELLKEARVYNSFTQYGRKQEKTHFERNQRKQRKNERYEDIDFTRGQSGYKQQQSPPTVSNEDALAEAYILLGVSVGDDEKSIKRAYRRLLSQHHPDKIAGQGGSSAERELAHAKTIEIRKAYERICKTRGF